ncbi:purine catabolism regulator [Tamaricihabitans halophyticus]|uniref:Purine catabolism regulator n=1 Tax=Tamaricihabitans halophyticus TaxID=1262583 RepID=A0A4R2QUU7_9PSEU|nr:PucR family transcriptional regulator ligand-binding domain-containing protein [Tamaricihabitans halophyticus]TCP53034.1 purine catabolism regulator [Tamaricihabitans halophyticus]
MYPTVSDVLALPVVQDGKPTVVAGAVRLTNRVRWVHVAEVADLAHLLRGNELVLTTGIALPDDDGGLARYVDELAKVGAAGVVVELLRHWSEQLPEALVAAAQRHQLPLITLARETRFVSVTEAVAEQIVAAQVAELRAAEEIHQTFTALTVAGAQPAEVLREVAQAAGLPVVLETLAHEVLAYDMAGQRPTELLADWATRSRAVRLADTLPGARSGGRTGYDPHHGWLVTVVGARGHDWGRLVLHCPAEPSPSQVVLIERAASALAVHRLLTRDAESLERHAHRTLLTEILAGAAPDVSARSAALGVPLDNRELLGLAVRPSTATPPASMTALATQEVLRDLAEATALAVRDARVSALVAVVDDTSVRALLSLTPQADGEAVLTRLADRIHQAAANAPQRIPVVVGAGTTVADPADARRSLTEADQVAGAALRDGPPAVRGYYRLADVRLRGLLQLLRGDERLSAFAARELGALRERDAKYGGRLVEILRHFCECGGNKSAAAAAAHMSRTAYYQQLARVEQVLGVSLEDPESVLSLHVALLATETVDAQ